MKFKVNNNNMHSVYIFFFFFAIHRIHQYINSARGYISEWIDNEGRGEPTFRFLRHHHPFVA